ncbi:MAG: hypothetical protein J5936_03965 [Acholeplasmatales bacterium]|nr:hypothetical protein [Acholeplasmatales bacterium]
MKLMLRIFNLVFIGLCATALILLFTLPSFSLYSNVGIDVKKISSFVPETKYTKDLDISEMIGTDTIYVEIEFSLSVGDLHKAMNNDRETINKELLEKNITEIATMLQEPIDNITEYVVRTAVKSLIQDLITQEVKSSIDAAGGTQKPEDIMDEVGLNDLYFTRFADALYTAADSDDSSLAKLTDVVYNQIDDAISKAGEIQEGIDISGFDASYKEEIKNQMTDIFDELNITKDGGKLEKISELSYIYFSEYIKDQLNGKVTDNSVLDKKNTEDNKQYSTRMINIYVQTLMPDMFYTVVSYVCLGLFIGLFVFGVIWLFLLVITALKSLTGKPWTFFGPLFWIAGILEIIFGVGITVFCKFILPKIEIDMGSIPINTFAIAPRTYALGLSIVFLVMVVLMIPYTIFKIDAKKQVKEAKKNEED